jgi:CheY-like chemotaxis protein
MDTASHYLVVESSPAVREALCHVLLSFGIRGVPVAGRAEALQALAGGVKAEGAIIDIDNTDVEGIALVDELSKGEDARHIAIIVHTVQTSRDLVMRMVEQGVVGYLVKPFSAEAAKTKLAAIFSRTTNNDRRRHVRVKPDPGELVRVSFRLTHPPRLVSGRIVDISLGGLAVELFNPPAPAEMPPGMPLPRLELSLSGRELSPSASVVVFKSNVLALKFETLTPEDKKALERYIFRSISS